MENLNLFFFKSQVLSEKATKLLQYNKYTFDVDVKFLRYNIILCYVCFSYFILRLF